MVCPQVVIDNDCTVDDHSYIISGLVKNTKIGKYCSIATNVTIGADRHPTDWLSTHPFQYNDTDNFKPLKITTIGNDVWIGANVVIITGVSIGDGAIIGASSVVTRDIPPYAIVAGIPAKIIRYRFNENIINKLLKLKWWDSEYHFHHKNEIDFSNIEKAVEQIEMLKNKDKVV
ncbi:hypothetical protein A9G12_08125 [Gilliamella sp. wkB112]|nr:hypothetical protein A9G12_08125 [Gilliamella apicola]